MRQRLMTRCIPIIINGIGGLPHFISHWLTRLGGMVADYSKGNIARAAIKLALPGLDHKSIDKIARKSAYRSFDYILSISKLDKIAYQLYDQDIVTQALSQNRGLVIASLHMGPPDIGTLALTKENIPVSTVIGAGNQKPLLNQIGQHVLNKCGIRYIKRGDPMAVMKTLRNREAIFLHSDMRSREAPVTFFGEQTTAPISAINAALMMKVPIVFHYCTLKDNVWQLHFEPFELIQCENRQEAAQRNLQKLMHRMEAVIREHPELWIWHYDRFKLKKRINK
ncbi:lysophospholipid acyltransferase family protein [Endozoicomonas sp. Mp262]|uniref:lysophospholipid acyltransferase family protein n=1 Tax=Endozoicomonas sp. Mp262 TaxID=2919499 RepID=UPI0021D91434